MYFDTNGLLLLYVTTFKLIQWWKWCCCTYSKIGFEAKKKFSSYLYKHEDMYTVACMQLWSSEFRLCTLWWKHIEYRQIVFFHLSHDFVYAIAATENQKFNRTKNDSQNNRKICSVTENLLQLYGVLWPIGIFIDSTTVTVISIDFD